MFSSYIANKLLKLWGWKFPENPPQNGPYIFAGYPHTALLDTIPCVLLGINWQISFFIPVKESFDKPVIKDIMKFFHCLPITRNKKGLELMVNSLHKSKGNMAIAIEGTRSKTNGVKPGFHNIAKQLNLKIVPGILDWKNKELKIFEPFEPQESAQKTIEMYEKLIQPYFPVGKYPELESPLILAKSEKK